jgi:uncharacterized protein YcbX
MIGTISVMARYPIKSFAGELVAACDVAHYGLVGDRMHAFVDESREGFARYITARQIPEMLQYKAMWMDQANQTEAPQIKVTAPDGRVFGWDDQLLAEIRRFSERSFSRMTFKPEDAELMAVDNESILIITDVSLRALEQQWGKSLDERRFRANLIIAMNEGKAFAETEWLGRTVRIGGVELQVNAECHRCAMVTIDPDHIGKDASLLDELIKQRNQNFGVYASVVKEGSIRQGDSVYLV